MIDTLKNYVSPKRFSIFAYVCVILHLICGSILTAITTALRLGETEKFSCAVDTNFGTHKTYVEKTCFSIYDDAYNSPVRLFGFVLLCFGSVVVVSVIYSLAVGNRIDETERYSSRTDGPLLSGANQPGRMTFYVFYFYFIHHVVRSTLGILFTILQYTVLYPSGFHSQFSCVYPELTQADTNTTRAKNASVPLSTVTCTNSAAQDKQFWGTFVCVYNVIFTLIMLLEVIYMIRGLTKRKRFPYFKPRSWSCDLEFIIKYFLRKQHTPENIPFNGIDSHIPNSANIYKEKVKNASLTPDINYGTNTSLDDIFIQFVIQTGQAPLKFVKGTNRHELYDVYMKVPEHSICLKEIKDLFYPNNDTENKPTKTIFVLGRPGIGKTVLTRKIMRDWANGTDGFYHDKIAFFLKFRWFHFEQLQNLTLKKFLQFGTELSDDEFEHIFEEILKNPQNAIFIFDGLDEFGGNLEKFQNYIDRSRMFGNDPACSMSAIFLFIKILSGHILAGATVLVTSRPTASDVLGKLHFDRKVEIIGFTEDKIENYVEKFCANHGENELKPMIWTHIKSSELKNLCYIPVNCFIVCVTLLNCLSDPTNDNALPTTLTELYQAALVYFYKHHDRNESHECYEKIIKELQQLAFIGIENEQLIFDSELVNEQMKESGLLHCLPVPFFQIQTQVCFIHLTVQEFLAAKHLVETKEPEDIKELIFSHVQYGKWHLVLQFLAGLLGRKMKMSDQYRSCVLSFTEHLSCEIEDEDIVCLLNPSQILVMKCLRETGNEDFAKETATTSALKDVTYIVDVYGNLFSPSDCAAMVFLCKHLNFLRKLNLRKITSLDCLLELAKLLQDRCIETLALSLEKMSNLQLGLEHVVSVLTKSDCRFVHTHSKLTHLGLCESKITDIGVSILTQFLKNSHAVCLQELNLKGNDITSAGISTFCEVLGNEAVNQLEVLNFGYNNIGDDGMRILCRSLNRNQHTLKELNLEECSLTTESIFCLVEVLSDEHCEITHLILGGNEIDDEGVRMLCGVFRQEQWRLDELDISDCSLTHRCMPYLSEALVDEKFRINELSLHYNKIGDEGVRMLFSCLTVKQCSLTKLNLWGCFLTEKCMAALCETLGNEHCRLTNLNLGENDIGDEGARMLCCALRKGQCKLTVLGLYDCSLTDECMPSLCEALGDVLCKLTKLELDLNHFTDKYLSSLSDTLKLEHCCLENLDIGSYNFTDEGEKLLKKVENSEYCKARGFTISI